MKRLLKLLALMLPAPLLAQGDYPLNFDVSATHTRSERVLSSIMLSGSLSTETQSIATGASSPYPLFTDCTGSQFGAQPGETLTPSFGYSGTWMDGYVYIDFGCDGQFSYDTDGALPAEGSDIVSYSFFTPQGSSTSYDSHGNVSNHNNESSSPHLRKPLPSFALPADMPTGLYRMRYKVDWDNIDPGGNASANNSIAKNGGAIVDTYLNVHRPVGSVTVSAQNGTLLAGDSTQLSEAPYGQPLSLLIVPAQGYRADGIVLRHGHLHRDSVVHGTPQWRSEPIPASLMRDGRITLPADLIDGDLHFTLYFTPAGGEEEEETGGDYPLSFADTLCIDRPQNDRCLRNLRIAGGTATKSISLSATAPVRLYNDKLGERVFARPGQTLTATVGYKNEAGGSMGAYLYIDYNNDGRFTAQVGDDHRPTLGSELVSYSCLDGYNSEGSPVSEAEAADMALPAVTLPRLLTQGVYRARLKIDRNSAHPGGSDSIAQEGGSIVDFLLHVSSGSYPVSVTSRHGSVTGGSSKALPAQVVPGSTSMVLNAIPVRPGYRLSEFRVKHGLNLQGDSIIHGNRQWSTLEVAPKAGSDVQRCTLTSSMVDGAIEVTALFENESSPYEMIFNDEFDSPQGGEPDADKWVRCQRANPVWKRFLSNSPLVCYQQQGELVLRAIPNPDKSTDSADMLSGGIESRGKFSFYHGYAEARIRVMPHSGNFPAFWMMPANQTDGWPTCGEIDIMEQINNENVAYHTVHSNWTYNLGNTGNPRSSYSEAVDMSTYHHYGFEWTADTLYWYVDGQKVCSYHRVPANAAKGQWPFDKEFYLILNQSVGNGSWAAAPDLSHTYELLVDWVRVYQKRDDSSIGPILEAGEALHIKTAEKGQLTLWSDRPLTVHACDLSGRTLFHGTLDGSHTLALQSGLYVVNGRKIQVR